MRVSGTLAFRHPIIDDASFAQRFGGFRYRVFGIVDQENRENKGGPPQPVEIAVAEFEIPTPPNIHNLPLMDASETEPWGFQPGATPDMNYSPYARRPGAPMPYAGNPQDNLGPLLSLTERVMARNEPRSMSDEAWKLIGRQSETAVSTLRDSSDRQTQLLISQIDRLERQLEEERRVSREQSNRPTDMVQMVDGMSRLVSSTKGNTDSEVLRQMRDDHERLTRQMSEDHERSMTRVREENERVIARMNRDAEHALSRERENNEMRIRIAEQRSKDLEHQLTARENDWRNEADRREARVREDMQRVLDMHDREHTKRVEELTATFNMQLQNLREMQDREVRMNESVQTTSRAAAEQAHAIEMRSITSELAKAKAELSEKARLLSQYESEKNKPLLEQVREHKETMESLGDLAGRDDDDDEKETGGETKWWNSPMAQQVAGVLVSEGAKLIPKAAEGIKAARETSRQQSLPAAPPARRAMQMPPAMRRSGLPGRTKPRVTFSDADGPRLRSSAFDELPAPSHEGDVSQKVGAPRPFTPEGPGYDYDQPAFEAQSMPQPQPMAAQPRHPTSARPAPSPRPAPAAPSPAPAAQATPPAAAGQADDWSAFSWLPMSPGDVKSFIEQMNLALTQGASSEALGQSFCANYPPDVIVQLLQTIDVKRLVESIRVCPATKDLPIASGKGKRFLSDTWAYMNRFVQAQAQAKQEPTPEPEGEEAREQEAT
jgi:hypothetical protein